MIRLIYLFEIAKSPYFGAPFLDELYHLNWARDIARGKLIARDAFFRAPLYSYLLGIFIRTFGVNFFIIRLAQHIIGAGAVLAIYSLTRRIFSRREARIAGILAACYAPFFFFEGEMLDIFLQFLFYPLILIQALRTLKSPTPGKCLILGVLTGLSAIARPNILLFVPVLLIFLGVLWKGAARLRDIALRVCLILLGTFAMILPATMHNAIAGRCFVPIASYGGVNFYIGNNPNTDGFTARTARRMTFFGRYQDSVEMFAKDQAERHLSGNLKSPIPNPPATARLRQSAIRNPNSAIRPLSAAAVSRYWSRRALKWIWKNPLPWALLMLKKAALFFGNYEIKNNKNIYFVARYTPILRFFLSFLPYAIVGALGLIGFFFALKRERNPATILLALFLVTYTASAILFFVSARYRAPALTAIIPCTAFALTTLWDAAGRHQHGTLFGGMGAICILVFLSFIDWFHVKPTNLSRDHWSVGNCFQEKHKLTLAEKEYRIALSLDPAYDDALNNLGEVLYKKGDYGEALATFRHLTQIHPDYAAGYNNLGACYEKLMILSEAERAYRCALRLNPAHLLARTNLAEVLLKQGKTSEARSEYEKALRIAHPDLRARLLHDKKFQPLRIPANNY